MDDGGEVVIGQYHVGRLLGDLCTCLAHRYTNVRTLQSRCVVNAVAGHSHDLAVGFERLKDLKLVGRRNPRKD